MVKAVFNVLLILSLFWGVLIYDISSHGSLESSRTGRILKDAGLLIHVKPFYSIVEKNVITWYKWGKKNFPYKEYQLYKNKTLEVTTNIGGTILKVSRGTAVVVKKYSVMSYDYVVARIPPNFTESALRFLSNTYETASQYTQITMKFISENSIKARKWLLENVSKNTFTWENMEKVYFETTQKIGILYTDFTSWIGRKVQCLMSS